MEEQTSEKSFTIFGYFSFPYNKHEDLGVFPPSIVFTEKFPLCFHFAAITVVKAMSGVVAQVNSAIGSRAVRFGAQIERWGAKNAKLSMTPVTTEERVKCDADGTDLAAETTIAYKRKFGQLWGYRAERFVWEAKHVFNGSYFKNYTTTKFIQDLRFAVRILAMFLVGVCIGRGRMFPFLEPGSLLLEPSEGYRGRAS